MITTIKLLLVAGSIWMLGLSPTLTQKSAKTIEQDSVLLSYPDNVMAIIENKCIGCHKPDSKNEKARDKLQWEQLPTLEATELLGKLDDILEVLEKGEMPPEKMLERFPDKKLTDDEVTILSDWANASAKKLMEPAFYPESVMAIIENKCIGCHKPDSKNEKARDKLQWVQLPEMEATELAGKLDEILEVLEKGEMPPSKMLERFPDKKLTDDEVAMLTEWAGFKANKLMGE